MTDKKLTALTGYTTHQGSDLIYLVSTPGGTPASKKVEVKYFLKPLMAPYGTMINGKLAVTVASNNITVALKTLNGNDPSADNPVIFRLGTGFTDVEAPLSVTKNAGTNWMNAGGAELATKEIDFFVYVGLNATDGVTLGFARIPYATIYSDFSVTSTNEKYAAISTITHAAASDDYAVIGRFAATLSAGAGYTWSVPTFTAANLIQRPIYETRWLTYVPTVTATTNAITTVGAVSAAYRVKGMEFDVYQNITITTNGTATGGIKATLPFTAPAVDIIPGRETAVSGKIMSGTIAANNIVLWLFYDNSHPGANSANLIGKGSVRII